MNDTTPANDYAALLRVAPDGECQRSWTGLVTAEQVYRWESVNGRSAWVPDNRQQTTGWLVWWIPFETVRAILALSVAEQLELLAAEAKADAVQAEKQELVLKEMMYAAQEGRDDGLDKNGVVA